MNKVAPRPDNPPPVPPSWGARMLAVLAYWGLAPWLYYPLRHQKDSFQTRHIKQANVLIFIFMCLFAFFLVGIIALSYTMIYQRSLYDSWHPEGLLLSIARKAFLCWLVCWAYALILALSGAPHLLPGLGRLIQKKRFFRLALCSVAGLQVLLLLLAPFAAHAASLPRTDEAPAPVYLLYEDVNTFPQWFFGIGFYRISLAAQAKWGAGSVVMLPLTEASIARAVAEGRFVFLGSHGMAQGLLLKTGFVKPEMVSALPKSPTLQYVYLTSCDSGAQQSAWEKAFSPAKVVTYNRLTAVVEHLWWMWFTAPRVIHALD